MDERLARLPLAEICDAASAAGRLPGGRNAYCLAAVSLIVETLGDTGTYRASPFGAPRVAAELLWPPTWEPGNYGPPDRKNRRALLIHAAGAIIAEIGRVDAAARRAAEASDASDASAARPAP